MSDYTDMIEKLIKRNAKEQRYQKYLKRKENERKEKEKNGHKLT